MLRIIQNKKTKDITSHCFYLSNVFFCYPRGGSILGEKYPYNSSLATLPTVHHFRFQGGRSSKGPRT